MDETIKRWVGGVCVHENKVLLIHRINKERILNQEYFIFPGKETGEDESMESALVDAFKELSMTVTLGELLYAKDEEGDEQEYYYLCNYVLGEPLAQASKNEDDKQSYNPLWVSLSDLDELIIYPESIKEKLLDALNQQEEALR